MANLELVVRVGANLSGFRNGIRQGIQGVKDFDKEVQRSAKKRQAINDLGNGFGKVGLAAGLAAAAGVKKFADFDQAMSAVKATGEDAVRSQEALRQAALDAGAATKFNATESANAIEEMIKAGVSAKDVLGGGLKGALDLAAAGNLGVADAAGIAATALQQFGLDGDQTQHVADLMAAAAGKAQGEVGDFALALKYAGVPAKSLGVSIEQTTGTLGLFAEKGILADQAGTNLRSILLSLAAPTKIARKVMDQYGLSLYGADGKFVGVSDAAEQLHDRLGRLGEGDRNKALEQIFGREAIAGAITLYEAGAKGVDKWTKAVDDQGFAAKVASTRMDNLKGDVEQLGGALETAFIGTGEGANGALRDLVQNLTGLVDVYNDLSPAMKDTVQQALILVTVLGATGFAASKSITGYANLKNSLTDLGLAQKKLTREQMLVRGTFAATGVGLAAVASEAGGANKWLGLLATTAGGAAIGSAFGPLGTAIGGVGAGLYGLTQMADDTSDSLKNNSKPVANYAATLDKVTTAATSATRALAFEELRKGGAVGNAAAIGINPRTLTSAALGGAGAIAKVKKQIADAVGSGDPVAIGVGGELLSDLAKINSAFDTQQRGAEAAAFATRTYKESLSSLPKDVRVDLKNRGYEVTSKQIDELRTKYNLTPGQVNTIVKALGIQPTKNDLTTVQDMMGATDGLAAKVRVSVEAGQAKAALQSILAMTLQLGPFKSGVKTSSSTGSPRANERRKANGGAIAGAGSGTSDSIPAWLSNGEHVWTAKEVQAAGGQAAVYAMRQAVMRRGYAGGGAVGSSSTSLAFGMPSSFAIQITNWETGEGRMVAIAGSVYDGNANHRAAARRAGRKN